MLLKIPPVILILCFAISLPQEKEASFVRENITMKIERDHFYVIGSYYLKNNDQNGITLVYPFPTGPEYGAVDSFYIFNLSGKDTIKVYKSSPERVLFSLELEKDTETGIQVSYRQKLNSNVAKYIITTTRVWQEPLESAYYQLIVPEEIKITSFSILPDDSLDTGSEKIYYWKKFNFMPEKDMVFHFNIVR
jgi:hypothetical protein